MPHRRSLIPRYKWHTLSVQQCSAVVLIDDKNHEREQKMYKSSLSNRTLPGMSGGVLDANTTLEPKASMLATSDISSDTEQNVAAEQPIASMSSMGSRPESTRPSPSPCEGYDEKQEGNINWKREELERKLERLYSKMTAGGATVLALDWKDRRLAVMERAWRTQDMCAGDHQEGARDAVVVLSPE